MVVALCLVKRLFVGCGEYGVEDDQGFGFDEKRRRRGWRREWRDWRVFV